MATSSNTTTSPTIQDEDSSGSLINSNNSSESNGASSDSSTDIEDATTSTKSKSITYTRQQKITFAIVSISQFFVMTSISLPAPFLPRMDEKHGVDSDYTGWLIGIGSLIQLILSPLAGKLIPLIGLHTSIVFGLFFTGGVTALFGVLQYLPEKGTFADPDTEYLVIAFILRAVYALGFTAFSAAGLTILSVTFKENTTTIFSYSETIVGVGVMAGPALGSGFYAIGGFMTTFAANGAIVITCSIFMYFLLPHNVGAENEEDTAPVSVCTLLSNVNLVFGLILTAYSATMWACIDPILEPELRTKYGLSQEFSALSFLLLSVTYSIMAILVGKFLDKQKALDSISIMMFGLILMALNFIPMGPSPILTWLDPSLDLSTVRPMWLLLTCVAVLGVGLGCTIIPTLSLLFDGNSDEDETSTGNSTATNAMLSSFWASAYALGDWAGPVVSGFVVKQTSFGWTMTVYFFSTVVIVLAIIILKISQAVARCRADTSTLTLNVNIESSEDERKPLIAKS